MHDGAGTIQFRRTTATTTARASERHGATTTTAWSDATTTARSSRQQATIETRLWSEASGSWLQQLWRTKHARQPTHDG